MDKFPSNYDISLNMIVQSICKKLCKLRYKQQTLHGRSLGHINHFKPETHLQTTCFVYFTDQISLYRKIDFFLLNNYCYNIIGKLFKNATNFNRRSICKRRKKKLFDTLGVETFADFANSRILRLETRKFIHAKKGHARQAMSGRIGYMCCKSHLLCDLHVLYMSGFNFLHVRFSVFLWQSSH